MDPELIAKQLRDYTRRRKGSIGHPKLLWEGQLIEK
jgi:hypothetical protein